jgi:hypothetical protein
VIFYAIYKNQGNHFTIGVTLLQGSPQKESFFCNVAPGRPTGAVEQNLARLAGVLAGQGWGGGLGLPRAGFGGSDGGGAALANGHAGGQGRRPPRLLFPASWGSVGPVDGSARYGRGRGG